MAAPGEQAARERLDSQLHQNQLVLLWRQTRQRETRLDKAGSGMSLSTARARHAGQLATATTTITAALQHRPPPRISLPPIVRL